MSTSAAESYVYRDSYWGNKNLHYYQFGGGSDHNTQKPYAPTGIFSNTQDVVCSNGIVKKSDDWKINKLNTFYRWIIIEAENTNAVKEVSKAANSTTNEMEPTITGEIRRVLNPKFNNKVWNNAFVEFKQNKTSVQHSVTFNIRNVLSNIGYDIYLVTAPALANDSNATDANRIPTKMDCTISYHDQQGKDVKQVLKSKITNNADIVDYLLLAEDFKFPTASYGVTETESQVTLEVKTNVTAPELRSKKFDRVMRIDCIMLVPHGISNVTEDRFEVAPHGDGDSYFWLKQ